MDRVTPPRTVERVVVIPRNGYINRIQAWASASLLAENLGSQFGVLWEPESIAPAEAGDLFETSAEDSPFISREEVDELIGGSHEDLPRYISSSRGGQLLTLAGHDRGEQAFMAEVQQRLDGSVNTLVIIAGGKFHLPEQLDAVSRRSEFYAHLAWSSLIASTSKELADQHPEYLGLHLRGTDRSIGAPTPGSIRQALTALKDRSAVRELFVAADSQDARTAWHAQARGLGFEPWAQPDVSLSRSKVAGGVSAMIDWILLGHSQALVFPAASSFGEEAAVATGNFERSIGVRASAIRQSARRARGFSRSVLTFPQRRWAARP